MKKVLFVATITKHIEGFHSPYLKMFKEKGYEVHVATGDNESLKKYCDKKFNITLSRSPYKFNNLIGINQLKKIIEQERYEIIHCHTPMGGVATRLAAKKARKKYNTRVIYTAHGFHFFKGAPLKNWLMFYPVEWFLSKYTDTLITINKEDYKLAKRKFDKRCNNVEYVPGVGIDIKKFDFKMTNKEKHDLRKSLGLKDDDFVLIFPARLDKNKNQGFLINCMKDLVKNYPNFHLLLPGVDELNGHYQKMAIDKGIENNIHFLGYRSDIPQLMKISNIAVTSSLREGLPVNILESLACGLPVVALDCRGIDDLIVDNMNGFVIKIHSPHCMREFNNALLKIYNNNNIQFKYYKNNIKRANDYSTEIVISYFNKIYFLY